MGTPIDIGDLAQRLTNVENAVRVLVKAADAPPDPTREATLREVLAIVGEQVRKRSLDTEGLPIFEKTERRAWNAARQTCLDIIEKLLLTTPAPQPPEPVESRNRDAEINRLRAREAEMVAGFESIIDMIDNCADVPRNPDSLPMMVLQHARATLAGGYDALTAARQEPSHG